MKILLLESLDNPARGLRLAADSAWRPDRRPLFVPEGATDIALHTCRALRVGRLGKCISPRHAARYIDAEAIAMVRADLRGDFIIADDAIVLGPWQPTGTIPGIDIDAAAAALAELSRGVTFKTGDILILPPADAPARHTAPATVAIDTPDGATSLISFNIR